MDNDRKKELALNHLRTHPMDYNGCAKLLNMEYLEFLEFRGMHVQEFQNVEDATINLLEHLCMMKAMGQTLPAKYEDFDFQQAKWVLQCRGKGGWSTTTKVQNVSQAAPQATGKGKVILDRYFDKTGKTKDEKEAGVTILSETARRNLQ